MILSSNEVKSILSNFNIEHRKLAFQISAHRKISDGSDNTNIYAREIYAAEKLNTFKEIKVQIQKTEAQNLASDAAARDIKSMIQKIKSELISANTSTTSDSDRKIIANQLKAYRENIFDFINTRIEDDYVFAGHDSTKQTFIKDSNGKIVYNGDIRTRTILTEEGSYRKRGVTGVDLMMYPTSVATKLQPTLEFKEENKIIDQNGEEWKLNASKTAIVRYDYKGEETTDTKPVTSNGLTPPTYSVNVGTADGTRFEAKRNIFEVLDDAINALNKVDSLGNPINTEDARKALGSTLTEITKSFDTVNTAHSLLGTRNKVFEIAGDVADAKVKQFEKISSDAALVNPDDIAEAILKSKALELSYAAVYSTISKTSQLSLVNYVK